MNRTRIKICGITRLADAQSAIDSGADALGFVFYEPSPRYISPEDAAEIIAELPAFISTVGLFVNASSEQVEAAIEKTGIDLLQFHGDESPEFCDSFSRPWFKALRMKPGLDVASECSRYQNGTAILLDAYRPGVPGGTGEAFDWDLIPSDLSNPLILAGGLSPSNVHAAITQVQPYAVDISGGVEASKGIKDSQKIAAFMQEVLRANHE